MIKIICVGKLKEKYLKDALDEYKKRISKYTKLEIIELNDYIICLDIKGNMVTSEELASKIDKIFIQNPCITFIIGGSYGIHEDIKKMSNELLSFSSLTFPHQLFRVMLLEQIYRVFKIQNNESYHK